MIALAYWALRAMLLAAWARGSKERYEGFHAE